MLTWNGKESEVASTTLNINLSDMPEAIAGLRRALANRLRSEAEGEPEFIAAKLRRIAAEFEVGIDCGGETDR